MGKCELNGVDFRATGNEPPWVLELTAGAKTVLTIEYSKKRYVFDTPDPVVDVVHRKTMYVVGNKAHWLTIVLSGSVSC